jgi:hypothetical protein
MSEPKDKPQEIEANGAVETFRPTMIEQVWGGYNELARYGTMDESEYVSRLRDMNRSELESHARKHGVMIVESSERLRDKLLREFNSYKLSLRLPEPPKAGVTSVSAEALKILAEGR